MVTTVPTGTCAPCNAPPAVRRTGPASAAARVGAARATPRTVSKVTGMCQRIRAPGADAEGPCGTTTDRRAALPMLTEASPDQWPFDPLVTEPSCTGADAGRRVGPRHGHVDVTCRWLPGHQPLRGRDTGVLRPHYGELSGL